MAVSVSMGHPIGLPSSTENVKMKIPILILSLMMATHQVSNAALAVTQTTDNGTWPSLPAGYFPYTNPSGINGYYDAFSVEVSGTPGASINSLQFGFSFQGNFDDSIAFDLNSDGQIDWVGDFFDIYATNTNYTPWSNLADALNTKVYLNIGPSSSSVTLEVYGQVITQGTATDPDADLVNNLGSFTLSSLGLPATFPQSGSAFLTDPIRVGFVNTAGGGGGIPTIDTSNFFGGEVSAVPEPSAAFGSLAIVAVGLLFRRRGL